MFLAQASSPRPWVKKSKKGGGRKDLTSSSKLPRSFGKRKRTVTSAGQSASYSFTTQPWYGSAPLTSTEIGLLEVTGDLTIVKSDGLLKILILFNFSVISDNTDFSFCFFSFSKFHEILVTAESVFWPWLIWCLLLCFPLPQIKFITCISTPASSPGLPELVNIINHLVS